MGKKQSVNLSETRRREVTALSEVITLLLGVPSKELHEINSTSMSDNTGGRILF